MNRFCLQGILMLGVGAFCLAAAEPRYVSFLACPIARDAGADADVCFVADYQGELVALVNPPDWGAPQLHHQVLVEGAIKAEPGSCGGLKLEGRVSVMLELAPSCDTILPYDGSFKGSAGGVFNSGSPAQRAHAQALAARAATDPAASLEPAVLDIPDLLPPTPPYITRTLVVNYPFESTRASGPDMMMLKELVEYGRFSKARSIVVTGYQAVSELSDGRALTERAGLSRSRAEKVAQIMRRLGVDARRLTTRWEPQPVSGTGRDDWRNRKVEIILTP